jgi:hypothetical protein
MRDFGAKLAKTELDAGFAKGRSCLRVLDVVGRVYSLLARMALN